MDYQRIYNELIKHRQGNILKDGYFEQHHIIPKCLDGTNDKSNIIKLTAREHFLAHMWLIKIYPKHKNLIFAARMMLVNNQHQSRKFKVNGRLYESLKIAASKRMAVINRSRQQIYNTETGKIKWLDKSKSIPNGWKIGTNKATTKNTTRYYNSKTNEEIMLKETGIIPDGFVKGRRKDTYIYNKEQVRRKLRTTIIPKGWYLKSPQQIRIVNLKSGKERFIMDVDKMPTDFENLSNRTNDRSKACKHLYTGVNARLSLDDYDKHIDWLPAQTYNMIKVRYNTDIGIVRCLEEYVRKSGRVINLKKYCLDNQRVVTHWLMQRCKLPCEWKGKTWEELGFGVEYITPLQK